MYCFSNVHHTKAKRKIYLFYFFWLESQYKVTRLYLVYLPVLWRWVAVLCCADFWCIESEAVL